jgi:uncharacterized protein
VTRVLFLTLLASVLAAFSIDEAESQSPFFLEQFFPFKDQLGDLLPLAEKGDARAQFQLGTKYLRGRATNKDITEGLRWLRASGDQGFIRATAVPWRPLR